MSRTTARSAGRSLLSHHPLDPRSLGTLAERGSLEALAGRLDAVSRAHHALLEEGELPTQHLWDPVGVEDQQACRRHAEFAKAWLEALGRTLGPSTPVGLQVELVSPFSSPSVELVSETVGGEPLPENTHEHQYAYLQQRWLRLRSEDGPAWSLRVTDVFLRDSQPMDVVRAKHAGNLATGETFRYSDTAMRDAYQQHQRFRTRLRWTARLGSMSERYAERLRADSTPLAVGEAELRCAAEAGVVALQVDLAPGRPLETEHIGALLKWLWPSEGEWAAGRAAGTGPLSASELAVHEKLSPGLPSAVFDLPDEAELERFEAWAQQVRRRHRLRRLLTWPADFLRPPLSRWVTMPLLMVGGGMALMSVDLPEWVGAVGFFVAVLALALVAWWMEQRSAARDEDRDG